MSLNTEPTGLHTLIEVLSRLSWSLVGVCILGMVVALVIFAWIDPQGRSRLAGRKKRAHREPKIRFPARPKTSRSGRHKPEHSTIKEVAE